jgi:hypothetical protein
MLRLGAKCSRWFATWGPIGEAWPAQARDNGGWKWQYRSSMTGRRSAIVCNRSEQKSPAFIGRAHYVETSVGRLNSSVSGIASIGPALPAKIRRDYPGRLDKVRFPIDRLDSGRLWHHRRRISGCWHLGRWDVVSRSRKFWW